MAGHATPGVAFAHLCVPFPPPPFPSTPSPRDLVGQNLLRSLITTFRAPSLLGHTYLCFQIWWQAPLSAELAGNP
jgi:hypothetical protein